MFGNEVGPELRSALCYLVQSLLQPVGDVMVIFASESMKLRRKEVKEGGGGRI